MMKVAIIDYGSGNLHSVTKAFERAAGEISISTMIQATSHADDVRSADFLVLPGVGAFKDCREGLAALPGMEESLEEQVHQYGKPFLGICVGMQILATHGFEHDLSLGLNWIPGTVRRLEPRDASFRVPHVGWNTLKTRRKHPLLEGIAASEDGPHAYFVHSYHLVCDEPSEAVATTDHGEEVTAIAGRGNIVGTQFHPEKSQTFGIEIIANFLKWRP